jgi:choline dehydrogenase-like flavoprotein
MQESLAGEVELSEPNRTIEPSSLHPPLDTLRQRRLGGTTGSWGGRCRPLDPVDFEKRPYIEGSGWPFRRADLEPYYRRAQVYCEAGAFEYSSREAIRGSPPFLLPQGVAARFTDRELLRYSRPTDFGKTYRGRVRKSTRIRAMHHANVLRLEMSGDGALVDGAVAASVPGREFRVEADSFIVAGGGLETTRLLLVSAGNAGGSIGTSRGMLGHYYMTHLDGFVGRVKFLSAPPQPAYTYEVTRDGIYCRRLICPTEETLKKEGLLNFSSVLFMPPTEDPGHGDGLLSAFALAKQALYRGRIGFKSRRHALRRSAQLDTRSHVRNILSDPGGLTSFGLFWLRKRWMASRKVPSFLTASRSREYRLLFSAEQSPCRSNTVRLSSDLDRFGMPRLAVRWEVASQDHESIVRVLRIIAEDFHRLGLGTVQTPATPDELRMEIGGGFLGGTHAMGTTRMASSPRDGVVDDRCRVHGVENLYIASSSVFPTGGFAAPTLTIVALAIRVADTVNQSLRLS